MYLNLNIRAKGFSLTDALKASVEDHLRFILTRHKEVVERVDVTLMDINGANKGGIDKRCMIVVRLANSRSIAVHVTEPDMYDSIQYCANKLHRAMMRHLGRKRNFKREKILINDESQYVA